MHEVSFRIPQVHTVSLAISPEGAVAACACLHPLSGLRQQRRQSRLVPIIADLALGKTIQQRPWIVDITALLGESVAVIVLFQESVSLISRHTVFFRKTIDAGPQVVCKFLLGNAADVCILVEKGNVLDIVQVGKHAEFAEAAHACQEHQPDMLRA